MIVVKFSRCFILFVTLLWANQSFSQKEFSITTNAHYGFLIPHHASVINLIQGHTAGLEINLNWKTNTEKYWHRSYNHPSVGLDFFISQLGNQQQLGSQISSIGYVAFPLDKKHRHEFKTGVGLGYATKIWELESNPKNILLSSHLNAAVLLQYGYKIQLSDKFQLKTGVRLTHFSNGSYSLPNKGTNNLTVYLGVNLLVKKPKLDTIQYAELSILPYRLRNITTLFAFGVKQISLSDPNKYATYTLSSIYDKRTSKNTSWGLGLDLFYSSGLKNLINKDNTKASFGKTVQIGTVVAYTKHLNPWEIKVMAGVYLLDNYKKNGLIYNRFGIRYWVNNHLFTGLSLKTHYAKADHVELGVGWRF